MKYFIGGLTWRLITFCLAMYVLLHPTLIAFLYANNPHFDVQRGGKLGVFITFLLVATYFGRDIILMIHDKFLESRKNSSDKQ
ncbi:MAG: hypothetical protein FWH31_08070 [Streptococcaceae bacterium]|nr:hypothetical protein [Streptococcaceae bacterium]